MPYPSSLDPLFLQFSLAFTDPTYRRWLLLLSAALLTTGRRTVSNLLRTLQGLAAGAPSSYHRVFSQRRWSLWPLGRALAAFILKTWCESGTVFLAGDDTVTEHRGKKVYGKCRHRDAQRSSHSHVAHLFGHKWVVLSILVRFPFTSRPWALPVLLALYRSASWNQEHGRRHKTAPQLMRQLLCVLVRWFPEREFCFTGDGGFSPHESAAQDQRQRRRLTLVGRFHPQACLYGPPPSPPRSKVGRPRQKGLKLPTPEKVVANSRRRRLNVSWYGGKRRRVAFVTGTGGGDRSGAAPVEVRWGYVQDLEGTHRDEYFFSSAAALRPRQIIETFTQRWSIEVTFEEAREYLGLETTRGWSERTVLRMTPCLFGLFSLVALWYAALPQRFRRRAGVQWVGKRTTTFSDALTAVRRWLWREGVFKTCDHEHTFSKLPRQLRALLLYALAPAA